MPKNKISEFSSTPANNTDVGGIDIAEGCAPSGINNAIRELMAQLKDQQAGTDADNFTVGGNLIVNGTATGTTPTAGDSSTKFATTAFATTALQALHPVGSIYTSTVATNPNTLFGFGTWVAFGAGRVLIGLDSGNPVFDTVNETGGSANATLVTHSHTFTGNALPTHTHNITTRDNGGISGPSRFNSASSPVTYSGFIEAVSAGTPTGSNSTEGASATNANLQPYIVVYMWNRTA